jgi:hypothetical protein
VRGRSRGGGGREGEDGKYELGARWTSSNTSIDLLRDLDVVEELGILGEEFDGWVIWDCCDDDKPTISR